MRKTHLTANLRQWQYQTDPRIPLLEFTYLVDAFTKMSYWQPDPNDWYR